MWLCLTNLLQVQRGAANSAIAESQVATRNRRHSCENGREGVVRAMHASKQANEVDIRAVNHSQKHPARELRLREQVDNNVNCSNCSVVLIVVLAVVAE